MNITVVPVPCPVRFFRGNILPIRAGMLVASIFRERMFLKKSMFLRSGREVLCLTLYSPSQKMVYVSGSDDPPSILFNVVAVLQRWRGMILVFTIAVLLVLVFLAGYRQSGSVYWPGWFILRLPPHSDVSRVDGLLHEAGITGFISATNSTVAYMAIPGMEQTSIAEIDQVLTPGDPRRDPYITRIHKLFESGDSSLVYLPADRPVRRYRTIISQIEDAQSWQIMDGMVFHKGLVSVAIFMLLALFIAFFVRTGTFSPMRAVAILPLGLSLLAGVQGMVFPMLLLYFFSIGNCVHSGQWTHRPYAILIGIGFSVALIALFINANVQNFASLSVAIISSEMIYFFSSGVERDVSKKKYLSGHTVFQKTGVQNLIRPVAIIIDSFFDGMGQCRRRHEHRLFEPLSLMQSTYEFPRFSLGTAFIFLIVLMALDAFFLPVIFNWSHRHPPIPHTLPVRTDFDNLGSIVALDNQHNADSLPDVAMMLSSMAYQTGFLYGSQYRLPMPEDSLDFRHYREEGDSIAVSKTAIEIYDQAWFADVLHQELSQGVGLLFASPGGASPVSLVFQAPGIEKTYPNRIQIIVYGLALLVMVMVMVFSHRGHASFRSIYKSIVTVRRRTQVA